MTHQQRKPYSKRILSCILSTYMIAGSVACSNAEDEKLMPALLQGQQATHAATVNKTSGLTVLPQNIRIQKNSSENLELKSTSEGRLSYTIVSPPYHGVISGENSQRTYTPENDFVGVDHFTYKVSDGVNESEPRRVSISIEDENVTYHRLSEDFFLVRKKHLFGPNVKEAIGGANKTPNMDVAPGDRIVLPAGTRTADLRIWGLSGTAKRPIVIINGGGRVRLEANSSASVLIDAGRYIQFTGSGDANTHYGFDVVGAGKGIRVGQAYVKHIEISYAEITSRKVGILMNAVSPGTEQTELSAQVGINVNNNYLHDVGTEALYLGKSNRESSTPPEHPYGVVREINVAYNRIINSGFEAIQVRNTRGPGNKIHHNTVIKAGYIRSSTNNDYHGVFCMDVRQLSVYNNTIKESHRNGIHLDGLYEDANQDGLNDEDNSPASDFKLEVYNNEIVGTGNLFSEGDNYAKTYGVHINRIATVRVDNNTIIRSKRWGVYLTSLVINGYARNNLLANIKPRPSGERAIIKSNAHNSVVENNEFREHESEFQFMDHLGGDFRIKAGDTSLVDKSGANSSPTLDRNDFSRPQGPAADIGAYENSVPLAHDANLKTMENTSLSLRLEATDREDQLSYIIVTDPANGILNGSDANLTYLPSPDFSGEDSFTYKVFDGAHYSEIRTVRIAVEAGDQASLHLQLNESQGDQAGSIGSLPLSGALMGSPAWIQGGYMDGALQFDGADDYLTLGQATQLNFNPTENDFTLSVWFKTNGGSGTLISKVTDYAVENQFNLFVASPGNDRLYANVGDGTIHLNKTVNDNNWYLAVLINDSASMTYTLHLYDPLNQTWTQGSRSFTQSLMNDKDILIGARYDQNSGLDKFFSGSLDDVRIYSRALNESELQELPGVL